MKLLFIPGSGSGGEVWRYQVQHFVGSEAISLPGHPDGEPYSSVDDYVEWLHAYITEQEYREVVLVGHSLGGAIALLYGLKYPQELKALALIGTGARLRVHPDTLEEAASMMGDASAWERYVQAGALLLEPEIRREIVEAKLRIGPAVLLSDFNCCDKFDIMAELENIKLPTLVICGTEDEMTPVKYSNYLTKNIKGATEVIIEGATHSVAREKPEEVNQAIEEFLAKI